MGCEKHGEHSIELDCPPGYPRPGDLIDDVIKDTGLPWPREDVSRVFGCWKWVWDDVNCENWDKVREIVEPRIKALYHKGVIRYGSW